MLDAADGELLSASAFAQAIGEKRSVSAGAKELRKEVTWLRKTPLMGNNLYDAVHKHERENRENKHVLKETKELITHGSSAERSLEDQIEAIERSFAEAALMRRRTTSTSDSCAAGAAA